MPLGPIQYENIFRLYQAARRGQVLSEANLHLTLPIFISIVTANPRKVITARQSSLNLLLNIKKINSDVLKVKKCKVSLWINRNISKGIIPRETYILSHFEKAYCKDNLIITSVDTKSSFISLLSLIFLRRSCINFYLLLATENVVKILSLIERDKNLQLKNESFRQ